jgi:Protein of unknown function (DUF3175)
VIVGIERNKRAAGTIFQHKNADGQSGGASKIVPGQGATEADMLLVHPGHQISTKACSPAATPSASLHRSHVRPSGANGASWNHTALSMLGFYINRAGKSFQTAGGGRSSGEDRTAQSVWA